ncbi:MAG: T9SS type A sorting domain-containing protein [Chitinophagales bacterium]|nr:T9SS type A sorting domain-containing protein [Chitinophagales bacterium]
MKKIKILWITIIALLLGNDLIADAWGQHYAKCYVVGKRYRAGTNISLIETKLLGYPCCIPGQTCLYSCTGCPNNSCYAMYGPDWTNVAWGVDKHCTSASRYNSYLGFHYLNGVYGIRKGMAFSKHEHKLAINNTYIANALTAAGISCTRYIPDTIDLNIDRSGFSKALTKAQVYMSDGIANIDSITGSLLVRDSTFYTAVFEIYIVEASRFDPEEDDPEVDKGCLDLDNYNIIQRGSVMLNGWGVSKSGIFSNMGNIVSTTHDSDTGSIRIVCLDSIVQKLSYSILEYDTSLVSIIVYADSYYDFEAENSSGKTDLENSEEYSSIPSCDDFSIVLKTTDKDRRTLEIKSCDDEYANIDVIDITGKRISNSKGMNLLKGLNQSLHLNTKDLPTGVYFVVYQSATRKEVLRFVVQH